MNPDVPQIPAPGSTGGQPTAQEAVRHQRPQLIAVAVKVVRHRGEAEDVVDEALARWVAQPPGGVHRPRAWLQRTVLNLAIDRARSWLRRQQQAHEVWQRQQHDTPAPPELLQQQELHERVWQAVLQLPERQCQVAILRDMAEFSYAQVAAALSLQESTVRVHVRAAREALRVKLARWTER